MAKKLSSLFYYLILLFQLSVANPENFEEFKAQEVLKIRKDIHRYVKREQAATFTKVISECDGSSVTLQVDFLENATLIEQDEIQSAHWTRKQVTIFTAHAWTVVTLKKVLKLCQIILIAQKRQSTLS